MHFKSRHLFLTLTELFPHEARTFAYVDEPDSDYFCPVCRDLLTDPFQLECGHHLCCKCRDYLLSTKKSECPTCRESNALSDARLDKYFLRKVNSVTVHCQYYDEGCEYVGEVRYLQKHIERCAIACPFDCGNFSRRVKMKEHKNLHCPNRPIKCENCDYYNIFAIVTEKHYPICPQSPVDCPNHCRVEGLRRHQLEQHLNECSHQLVDCPKLGGFVRLSRREMSKHALQEHNLVLEETNQAISIIPLVKISPYLYNKVPIEFIIPNFHDMKETNAVWTSVPFSSHERGYKLGLKVYPNGHKHARGSHVSFFFYLMKGEYDNELGRPFEGHVVLELLNWRADKDHILTTTNFNRFNDPNNSCTSHVTTRECAPNGLGNFEFISHSSLLNNSDTNTEYLQDDCLRLRVIDVAVYSTPLLSKTPSWQEPHTATQSVCDFTLTEFTKRKQFDNEYYSPPFYSHPHGYKLCVHVYANGYSRGKDTHISITTILMRGDSDDNLQWPFEGDIVVELLNWREDNHHYRGDAISFNRTTTYSSRVIEGEYSTMQMGIQLFISHSSLLYNPDTNTEYLQDDCLRLRVVDVAVYPTPLLSETPSWQDPHTATQSVCDFTLTEFTKRKQFNNAYYSPPFYSHPHGYKLCIKVNSNGLGEGKDTHISIGAHLMRGDYDNNLQWPFEGDIVVELLNWKEDNHHYRGDSLSANRHGDPNNRYTSQVTDGEYGNAWGVQCFISHSSLLYNPDTNTEYLQDDCLRVRVVDVIFYSTPLLSKTPSWQDTHTATQSVCDFTLTEFTKRKQFNSEYFGPSFYTHPHGYKMLLVLCSNGRHNAEGTCSHISVYVSILIGKYDSELSWPFEGIVTVELINWREDKNHLSHTIVFDEHKDPKCSSRVTDDENYGRNGSDDVFPHSSLPYNPVTNTEYLHDDCLLFRVREVRVHK